MAAPRVVWVMVPAGDITTSVIEELAKTLEAGDIVIDGGNSYYRDDIKHSKLLSENGIHLLDCGTSGGVWGRERGYCLMIGGDPLSFAHAEPLFAAIAPGVDAAPRTPGRTGEVAQPEKGYLYCGPSGAGHFVKMVHNGIEYGMMASLAEGLNILRNADVGKRILEGSEGDAETAPLSNPECYQYEFDIADVAEVWRRGSVVGSWLLDLTAIALHDSPELEEFSGRVSDSGKADGPRSRPSTRECPRRCSRRRCSPASRRAAWTTSPTRRCRRCASSSAGTRRSRPTDARGCQLRRSRAPPRPLLRVVDISCARRTSPRRR